MGQLIRRHLLDAHRLVRGGRNTPLTIRLIAVGKLIKAALFGLGALFLTQLVHAPELADAVRRILIQLHVDPDGAHAQRLVSTVTGLPPSRWLLITTGMTVYAGLYLIEGLGLWFDRRWAEWLTVVMTGLFIPFEAAHLLHRPSLGIALTLAINIVIVLYLALRIRAGIRLRRSSGLETAHQRTTDRGIPPSP